MCSPEFAQSLVREGMLLAWYQDLLDFTATGYGIFNFPNHLSASSPPPEFDWSNLQGSSIKVINNYSKTDETCDPMVNSEIFSRISGDAEFMKVFWDETTHTTIQARINED